MDNELMENNSRELPAFEEFKLIVLNYYETENALDLTANLYDRIPVFLRSLANFDPTGVASSIDKILSENKAKREQENILRAIYALGQVVVKLGQRIDSLDMDYKAEQFPELTNIYFQRCKETFEPNKINHFRNVLINSFIRVDEGINQKAYVFEMIDSLSEEQILTLKLMYEQQRFDQFINRKPVHIDQIGQALNIDVSHAQQICVSLQGKGLVHDSGIGKLGYKGPFRFVITDYVLRLVEYTLEI